MPAIDVKLNRIGGLYEVIIQQIAELRRKTEKNIQEIKKISRVMDFISREMVFISREMVLKKRFFDFISREIFFISCMFSGFCNTFLPSKPQEQDKTCLSEIVTESLQVDSA
ncbi:MAG: hypothetical protein LBU34_15045 [Planctomycetaceae bacterium]|nr:hypothetical protein [Planctomycetaceae bacterium]